MNPTERIKQLVKKHIVSLLLIGLIAYIWFRPPATAIQSREWKLR